MGRVPAGLKLSVLLLTATRSFEALIKVLEKLQGRLIAMKAMIP